MFLWVYMMQCHALGPMDMLTSWRGCGTGSGDLDGIKTLVRNGVDGSIGNEEMRTVMIVQPTCACFAPGGWCGYEDFLESRNN
jgi:hypothetical protein